MSTDKLPTTAPQPDYEKAEMDQLRVGLSRTFKERVLMVNTLYKVQQTFKRMKIIRTPYTLHK